MTFDPNYFPRYPEHEQYHVRHPRDLTWERNAGGGNIFGTLGSTDDSVFVSMILKALHCVFNFENVSKLACFKEKPIFSNLARHNLVKAIEYDYEFSVPRSYPSSCSS